MIKKALDFINEEIKGCIMNIKFCRDKGYDSPFHDQRLIDLNNLKEVFEKLLDKETPTLEEVKKEWEELRYSWLECDPMFIRLENKISNSYIVINKFSKTYKCFGNRDYMGNYLTMSEHRLLTKTFRALGWFE